ncbi:Myb-like DNA-binding domain [Musa troglodytarum]|uniref:Transcription factor MYBS1 n=1 Tax=Musa troglodytarum TaxID=320322 RepID=A0A9E7HBR1_9LILI|nr:Myb-like DNA-binding domain [Musa troglodytarum]
MEAKGEACWNWEKNKAFEITLAAYTKDHMDPWEKIAAAVPGTKPEEIKHHHELLSNDVNSIESGVLPLPNYTMNSKDLANDDGKRGTRSLGNQKRRKGQAWTVDEHRLFLRGLDKYGKGDWRNISRNCVLTRTPTQVASHAQKYFLRQSSVSRRPRTSILDISSADSEEDLPVSMESVTCALGTPDDPAAAAADQQASSSGMGVSVSESPVFVASNIGFNF